MSGDEARRGAMRGGCLGLVVLLFVLLVASGVWLGGVGGDLLAPHWRLSEIGLIGSSVLFALLFAIPARWAQSARTRGAARAWLLAIPFPIVLLPAALPPPSESQSAAALLAALALAYALGLRLLLRGATSPPAAGTTGAALSASPAAGASPSARVWIALALGFGVLLACPWLARGAVGSPLDVLLALAAGLGFGWAASLLVERVWLPVLATRPTRTAGHAFGDGLVVALTLLLMARDFGLDGQALLLLLGIPWLGWLVLWVARSSESQQALGTLREATLALLVGLPVAACLALSDSEPLAPLPLVSNPESLWWGLAAARDSAALALVLAVAIALFGTPVRSLLARPRLAAFLAALAILVAGLSYGALGQPGLYGDRLFVVLRDRADVSSATSIPDLAARRGWVYRTLTQHADATQTDLRRDLDRLGVRWTAYYLVNGLEVQGDLPLRWWLERRTDVALVVPSPRLRPLSIPSETAFGTAAAGAPREPAWNLTTIGAPRVWNELGVRGAGVIIGQSDTGVEWDHPELRDSYRGLGADGVVDHAGNWLDPWEGRAEPYDRSGHGTHTLGTVLGRTVGVAPGASWFGCANLVRDVGNPALYLDCLQFMLAPYPSGSDPFRDGDPTRAADVLNNSWGCPSDLEGCAPDTLLPAAQALRAAGIFVVASAGNDGPACASIDSPLAIYAPVFTVGAIGPDGRLTSFSSVGPVDADGSGRLKPDLVAPGAEVLSAFPGDSYETLDGTSMAGPHLVGVVALLWSASPALKGDVERTQQILLASAAPYQPDDQAADTTDAVSPFSPNQRCATDEAARLTPNPLVGHGVVDAYRAVRLALDEAGG